MDKNLTVSSTRLHFRRATANDAALVARLTNSAYRGDSSRAGWTTEADLLDGQRTDVEEILNLIGRPSTIVLLCLLEDEVVGSVNLQLENGAAYLGMLVVKPTLQARGIGKELIRAAEKEARAAWGIDRMTMTVISFRPELVAFYERRGYRLTGESRPFPNDTRGGIPLVNGLRLDVMAKDLEKPD
jgi:ribosomal protein S18 acetylase RimI-like enzyme